MGFSVWLIFQQCKNPRMCTRVGILKNRQNLWISDGGIFQQSKILVCVCVWGFSEIAKIWDFQGAEFSSRAKILVCVHVWGFLEMPKIWDFQTVEFSSRSKILVCVCVWGFSEIAKIWDFQGAEFSSRAKILVCVRVWGFFFICLAFKYIGGFILYGSNSGLSAKAERPYFGNFYKFTRTAQWLLFLKRLTLNGSHRHSGRRRRWRRLPPLGAPLTGLRLHKWRYTLPFSAHLSL